MRSAPAGPPCRNASCPWARNEPRSWRRSRLHGSSWRMPSLRRSPMHLSPYTITSHASFRCSCTKRSRAFATCGDAQVCASAGISQLLIRRSVTVKHCYECPGTPPSQTATPERALGVALPRPVIVRLLPPTSATMHRQVQMHVQQNLHSCGTVGWTRSGREAVAAGM